MNSYEQEIEIVRDYLLIRLRRTLSNWVSWIIISSNMKLWSCCQYIMVHLTTVKDKAILF